MSYNLQYLSNQSITYQTNCNIKNLDFYFNLNTICKLDIYIEISVPSSDWLFPFLVGDVKRMIYMGWYASLMKIHGPGNSIVQRDSIVCYMLYVICYMLYVRFTLEIIFLAKCATCILISGSSLNMVDIGPPSVPFYYSFLTAKLDWLVDTGLGQRDTLPCTQDVIEMYFVFVSFKLDDQLVIGKS